MTLIESLGADHAYQVVAEKRGLTDEELASIEASSPERMSSVTGNNFLNARRRWASRSLLEDPEMLERTMNRHGAWLATPEDDDWPEDLRNLGPLQPIGLWGLGDRTGLNRPAESNVAFVGCRDSTPYGNSITSHLAGDLAAEGYGILSGAAFGIDAAAHKAAMTMATNRPSTVAFLACGIDRPYPRAHEGLLRDIAVSGLVLTEVNPGCSPMRHRFLQRNRLIAAMSALVLVVEARWRSGALNTAHHALDLGRTVATVPGSVFSAQSAGCHRLLKETPACIATTTEDVRQLLPASSSPAGGGGAPPVCPPRAEAPAFVASGASDTHCDLTQVQQLVRDALPIGKPLRPERLCAAAGLDIRDVIPALAQLESKGMAENLGGLWRCARVQL
ncbi:DNA-processing protein DprA [Rothia uropygialis]|uniref:DNA-processing protein DprA n=1 Tax=Kocuria sp. 36 TaxID=1415402 RepID=UPI0013ED6196|nr:DNA-processing protein DprA [Kocuria sp. 36]